MLPRSGNSSIAGAERPGTAVEILDRSCAALVDGFEVIGAAWRVAVEGIFGNDEATLMLAACGSSSLTIAPPCGPPKLGQNSSGAGARRRGSPDDDSARWHA